MPCRAKSYGSPFGKSAASVPFTGYNAVAAQTNIDWSTSLGSYLNKPMCAARALTLVNSWETVRFELLNTRICDLGLLIEGSPIEPFIQRLYRELTTRGLTFHPQVYPTDGWGCPDEVPVIGVPFYLADRLLARIEEEQTGEIGTSQIT